MTDSLRARMSRAIVRFLEPQIQSIITERILKYNDHLVNNGAIKEIVFDHSLALTDEENSLLAEMPFVETIAPPESMVRTSLPPTTWSPPKVWRRFVKGEPVEK